MQKIYEEEIKKHEELDTIAYLLGHPCSILSSFPLRLIALLYLNSCVYTSQSNNS